MTDTKRESMEPCLVLLCGFPSSGTDLLKNLVNAHSEILVGGEFPLLPSLAAKYGPMVPAAMVGKALDDLRRIDVYQNFDNSTGDLPLSTADVTMAQLFACLLTMRPVTWVGNKTPQNSEHVRELNRLFPKARFIIIVRDVRDVALSWKNKWGKDPLLCADKWNRRLLDAMRNLQAMGPHRYLLIKYEDLLGDLEGVARSICAFLNISFQPSMLEYHRHVGHTIVGKLNYGQPIIRDNLGKWKNALGSSAVLRIEQIAYEGMQYFDYSPSAARGGVPLRAIERLVGRARDLLAMLFVGNRAVKENRLAHRVRTIRVEWVKRRALRDRNQ